MYYKSTSYRIAYAFILAFLGAAAIICVLPLFHVLAVSLSGKAPITANIVTLWPKDFTIQAYEKTFGNELFLNASVISVFRVVVGVSLSLLITVLAAYPLSKTRREFRHRTHFAWFFLFTMLFSGGLVPSYILMRKLHLIDSFWVLVLPGAVAVFNIILLLNFFRGVPKEMEEAAIVDGASQYQTLFRVYLPMSMPALATLALFGIVGTWNAWFDGLIFITNPDKWPLATLLQQIIITMDMSKLRLRPDQLPDITNRTLKAGQIIIAIIPVILIYPMLQKFFVKGIVIGAVKE